TFVEGNHSANRALKMIDTVYQDIIARYPQYFTLALTGDDIEKAHREHKIAALMGLEGGHAIENSPRLLRDYYRLGIRYMTLTHTNTNDWADSSGDITEANVSHHNGLTPLGKDVIREMNRLGMMVDISHVSDKTFFDALATSKAPLIASHSDCRAISNVPRNMTDEMIKALAAKGGVIQLSVNCSFVSQKSADANRASPLSERYAEVRRLYKNDPDRLQQELNGLEQEDKKYQIRATLDDVIANIDHVRQIAGIDSIGIGTDFDGVICTPTGLDDVSKFPNLTRALLEKGYTPGEIRKIYGENTLRLMRQVEAVARRLSASQSNQGQTAMKIEFKRTGGFSPITNASGVVEFKDGSAQVISPAASYERSLTAEEAAHLQSIAAPGKLESATASPSHDRSRDAFQYQVTITTKDGKQQTFNSAELEQLSPEANQLFTWVQKESQKILAHKAGNR
ncbi:MAG: dipeptidase, partial [Acidobacteriaceae bacterium]|nr:dipeptidase [Acidobacteriaceae bacterium]